MAQITLHLDYQVAGNRGRLQGQLDVSSRATNVMEAILILDEKQAEMLASVFAPKQADEARRKAQNTGPPVQIFSATFKT